MVNKTYLHINSRVPCAVTLNGSYAGKTAADRFIHVEPDGEGEIILSAVPINAAPSGEKFLPAAAAIIFSGGKPVTESPAVKVTALPQGHFELTVVNEAVYSSVPAAAIKQEVFTVNGERHTATIFSDAHKQLSLEGGGKFFTYILPGTFDIKELSVKILDRAAVIKAHGHTKDSEYLAVITYDGEYALNIGALCDKAEFEGDGIQTLSRLSDIARRGVVVTYTFNRETARYVISDHYTVYLLNKPKKPNHPSLIPFAFFQSVKAGDFTEARTFLSAALNSDIESDEALSAYFYDYDIIEENKYYPEIPHCAVLKTSGENIITAKLLIYKLDGGGKIDNLSIM